MSIDRAVISQTEILEDHTWSKEVLDAGFDLMREVAGLLAREPLDELPGFLMQVGEGGVGNDAIKVFRDGTDILGDRPFVVVEDEDQAPCCGGEVVEGFETYASCESGIPCHANDMFPAAERVAGRRHSKRGGKGRAGVAGAITIVLAFSTEEKAVQTLVLPDG